MCHVERSETSSLYIHRRQILREDAQDDKILDAQDDRPGAENFLTENGIAMVVYS
jgi:hypothetical protein